jgi:putative DNA primase/helicase
MKRTAAAYEALPKDMRDRPQWVTWMLEERDGKTTKVPHDPKTGRLASPTDLATWSSFDQATQAASDGHYSGIGFVFAANDPYTGIDLDHVRDSDTGALDPVAGKIVRDLDSYTEVTQSRTGLHVLIRAKVRGPRHRTRLAGASRDDAGIEMYDRGRFFVMTGDHLPGTPTTVEDRQGPLDALYAEVFPDRSDQNGSHPSRDGGNGLSDDEVMVRMLTSRNAVAIQQLMDGDTRGHHGDDSAADLALCAHLAYWTGKDRDQMRRLALQSRLRRDKWDSARGESTYLDLTIDRAIAGTRDGYDPGPRSADTSDAASQQTWTWAQLVSASEDTPVLMLIAGLLAAGDRLLIYGFAGVGKSLFGLCLALSLHLGVKFLDHLESARARVGYIDEESAPARLGQRLSMLARGYAIDPATVDLPVFHVQANDRLDTDEGVTRIGNWVNDERIDVLVIDTLRRVHRGRENEADDMAQIERSVKELQRRSRDEFGRPLTVVLLHHSPKPRSGGGGSAPETMARGSSDIVGWIDGGLYLHERDGAIHVEHAKARWTEQLPPFVVQIEATSDALRLKYAGAVAAKQSKGQQIRDLITRLLVDGPLSQAEIVEKAKAEGFTREKTIRDVLKAMVDDAALLSQKSGRAVNYALPDDF